MRNKDDVVRGVRWFRWGYYFSVLSILASIAGYSIFNATYKPDAELVLLTHVNSVYINEDLTQTHTTEGELKQFLHEVLHDSFTYDYLSFLPKETYTRTVNGELYSDLPDHRDKIRAFYRDDALEAFIDSLEKAPWAYRFEEEKRRTVFSMTTPPTTRNAKLTAIVNGRLVSEFNGYFYVISQGFNRKTARYRVDFTASLERRPNAMKQETKSYFFRPMAPDNNSEWRIQNLTWTSKRAN